MSKNKKKGNTGNKFESHQKLKGVKKPKKNKIKNKQHIKSKSRSEPNIKNNIVVVNKNKPKIKDNKLKFKSQENNKVSSGKKNKFLKKLNVNKLSAMLGNKEKVSENKNQVSKKEEKNKAPVSLRERMLAQLKSSRFRFLNEQMYSSESSETKKYFQDDPQAFYAYHEGYKNQVDRWPVNPLDIIIESIKKM